MGIGIKGYSDVRVPENFLYHFRIYVTSEHKSCHGMAGIRTNFRMPDILSIGIGGGMIIRSDAAQGLVTVGPDSVGYELLKRARPYLWRRYTHGNGCRD